MMAEEITDHLEGRFLLQQSLRTGMAEGMRSRTIYADTRLRHQAPGRAAEDGRGSQRWEGRHSRQKDFPMRTVGAVVPQIGHDRFADCPIQRVGGVVPGFAAADVKSPLPPVDVVQAESAHSMPRNP